MTVSLFRRAADLITAAAEPEVQPGQRLSAYINDPVSWCREFVDWRGDPGLTPYQEETLAALPVKHRVAVRGPHGLGKTTTKALTLLWFATTRDAAGIDWKAVTTAGAWRQLEKYLWPEIHKWAGRLRWDRMERAPFREGREILDLSIDLTHGEAFAAAASNAALIEGAHADHVLYLFDEAKAIPPDVWDAAEGAFSGATGGRVALALAQSTPGEPQGRFYEIHSRRKGLTDWWTRHVTVTEAIKAGRVSQEWADARKQQWGVDSALYANRVLGEFHSDEENVVIPLAWVEAANERWRAWDEAGRSLDGPLPSTVGVDVARSGDDDTVLALKTGDIVTKLMRFNREDTMATTGRVMAVTGFGELAIVDVIGVGSGVVDRLRELGRPVVAFNAGAGTQRRDRTGEVGFLNCRAAAWWNLREMLDPAFSPTLALPDDPLLIGDLTAPHWRMTSGGKVKVESKDDLKKRLDRSTDTGDAVVQACWRAGLGEAQLAATPAAAADPETNWDDEPL